MMQQTARATLAALAYLTLVGACGCDSGLGSWPDSNGSIPGMLQVKGYTDSLASAARTLPNAQQAPDDVDVNLTPSEYTIAFKRLVIKQVDEQTDEILTEFEIFNAESLDQALVVDLSNAAASDILNAETLPEGTYNKIDIEVFYLDLTVATIYPDTTSHDIPYRMVFEQMGLLEPRDLLLRLEPSWMQPGSQLASLVTQAGWYWMQREDPDNVIAVDGAASRPPYNVLDLFANEEFWSAEHKVLEGGLVDPPLVYDPDAGAVLTIAFNATGTFNFKDYHDESVEPDGQWEIRTDSGIHPFPPSFSCIPELLGE